KLVHQDFSQVTTLWMSRRAHRALLTGVDVDVGVRPPAVRELIEIRQRELGARARAARAPALTVECRQLAVARHTGLDVRERGRPIAGVQMLFLAIEHQLDRRARLLRELRADDALRIRRELAAEAPAHVLRDDPHARLRP